MPDVSLLGPRNPGGGAFTFLRYLRYHAVHEKILLREEDRLGDFTRPKRLQNLVGTEIAMNAA